MKKLSVFILALVVDPSFQASAAAELQPPPAAIENPPPAVQVDVHQILNARVVTTFTHGKVLTFQNSIDANSGVMTQAAADALGSKNQQNMSDNGRYPATTGHPEVVLNYDNASGTDMQVRRSPKGSDDEYSFAVPPKHYAKMVLFFISCDSGPAPLHFTLTYQDGSVEQRDAIVPDWYKNLTVEDKDCVYLAYNLAKWDGQNKIREVFHHNIVGVDLRPAPGKVLKQVKVHKTHPTVVFWGATGQLAN